PLRSAWSLRFASTRSALPRFALKRNVSLRHAPVRFALPRFALPRFAPPRFALLRSAPLRSTLLRSGRMLGFSSRHAFHAFTPFLSNATCSSFAMRAPRIVVLRPTIAHSVPASPRQEGLSVAVLVAYLAHMLQRTFPTGFIAPCLPTKTDKLPSGSQWLHEIKHDGFRIIARKTGAQVRLYSRPGNDLTLPADRRDVGPPALALPPSSMGRRLLATTTGWRRSPSFAPTATMTVSSSTPST